MRVLHVVWDLDQGGAQTYLCDLVRQHQASGQVSSEVLVLSHRGPIAEEIEKLGVPVRNMSMKNGYDLRGILRLHKYFQHNKSDIVHSHSHNFAFNWIVGRAQTPKILTEHGGNLLGGRWQDRVMYKRFGCNYSRFIAISKEMARVMQHVSPVISDRIRVVYNGVNLTEIDKSALAGRNGLPEAAMNAQFRVGIIGRLVPQKGIDVFLDTAAVISRRRKNITFPIIGDGPLLNKLTARADQLGIGHNVFFLGYRSDAKRILKFFDVFLFTSNYEPFGLVLAEAMAARVPIVAMGSKGAVHEILENGQNGFVVDQREPELLADRVIELLDNPALRQYFAQNARKKVERCFTIEQNAKKVFQIYQDCLQETNNL